MFYLSFKDLGQRLSIFDGLNMRKSPLHGLTSFLGVTLSLVATFYAPAVHAQANVTGTWQTVAGPNLPTLMPINP
ncbi:MAG TPA: hypothetical protein VHT31_02640, partial [Candidatus Acidoferrum sp.]|nr:hypothetical protein [Candidatus Acidoferrum sp.]